MFRQKCKWNRFKGPLCSDIESENHDAKMGEFWIVKYDKSFDITQNLTPETEIIYHNGNPNKQPIKDTFAVNDSTSDSTQPAVPKPVKKRKTRGKKTNSVSPMSKLLDRDSAVDDHLEGADRSSSTSGRGSSLDN